MTIPHTECIFSYGTLQYENVQHDLFGRKLVGQPDFLVGYLLKTIPITDPEVVEKSGESTHFIIEFSGRSEDKISGVAFQISTKELEHADSYEVDDYKRVKVFLQSGTPAWVYVAKNSQ